MLFHCRKQVLSLGNVIRWACHLLSFALYILQPCKFRSTLQMPFWMLAFLSCGYRTERIILAASRSLVICKSKSPQPWGHFNNVNQVLFHLQAKDTKMVMLPLGLKKNQYNCIENPVPLIRAYMGESQQRAQQKQQVEGIFNFFFFFPRPGEE